MTTSRRGRSARPREPEFTDSSKLDLPNGSEVPKLKLTLRSHRVRRDNSTDNYDELPSSEISAAPSDYVSGESQVRQNSRYQLRQTRISFDGHQTRGRTRASRSRQHFESETENKDASSDDGTSIQDSDVLQGSRKRKRIASAAGPLLLRTKRMTYDKASNATRRSERSTRNVRKMTEVDIDQIERSDSESSTGNAPRP